MSNYLNISKTWPFKMLPHTATPGEHFDDDWACKQIRFNEMQVFYQQKWIRSFTTKLQIISTIEPDDLKLYNEFGMVVRQFAWTVVGTGTGNEKAYQTTYDVTDILTDGFYWLYQRCAILSVTLEAISEPIWIRDTHRNVRPFVFSHSKNDFGLIFSGTNLSMTFMCESDMPANEYTFERDINNFTDQIHNVVKLSGYPYNNAKLIIGNPKGVPPYIVDITNRILCCDNVEYNGLRIETPDGSKWEINKVKGYPLIGGTIEVTPAKNLSSLQLNDEDPIAPGIIVAYDLDQGFMGTTNIVHITDIQQS